MDARWELTENQKHDIDAMNAILDISNLAISCYIQSLVFPLLENGLFLALCVVVANGEMM